jgi:tetratricopeptide (TPR) repeat protein
MTESFKESLKAVSSGHYDYEQAIKLYDREIEENPSNISAYNNRGLCKVHVGSDPYNSNIIKDGIEDFTIAIQLAEKEGVSSENTQHNLAWAINMLKF